MATPRDSRRPSPRIPTGRLQGLSHGRRHTDVWNTTTTASYDQAGKLVATSGPRGAESFTYDPAGRPLTQSLDGLTLATATYDNAGQLVGVVHPSGTPAEGDNSTGVFGYDTHGRHSATTWRQTDRETTSGVVTEATLWTTTDAVTHEATSGRVIDESIDGVDAFNGNNFTYDAVGRLTNAKVAGHDLTYGYASEAGCGPLTRAGLNTIAPPSPTTGSPRPSATTTPIAWSPTLPIQTSAP